MSFTDQDVLQQAQNTLIEPPDLGQTWPSGLWTMEEAATYLTQRQNRLLKDSHLQVGIANIPVIAGTETYDLPDDWIATIRVILISQDDTTRNLARADTFTADYGIPNWTITSGPQGTRLPKIYTDVDTPPLTVRLMPIPDANATLQVYYTPLGVPLDGSGEIMTVPDEFVPFIKYGVLADMLSKVARAQDPRAQYCEQRFAMGVEVAKVLLKGFHQ